MPRLLLGLIGAGIQASRTPAMQESEAAAHGLHCLYQLIDLDRPMLRGVPLEELLISVERAGFAGVNVTHPCKQAVLPLLDTVSGDARALGAVNTVVLRNGRREGHNTDWLAFYRGFREALPEVRMERVTVLGAGGAGSAAAYALLKLGAGHVAIKDVDSGRAHALVARCAAAFGAERVSLTTVIEGDGLVQATPVGMDSHPGLPLDPVLLRPGNWLAEVIYFPLETALLRTARELGCRTMDGTGMAVYQAAEAFQLFTGLQADAARMRRHLFP